MRSVNGVRAVTYDCWGTLIKDRDFEGAMAKRTGALSRLLRLSQKEAKDLLWEAWGRHDAAWRQVESFGGGRMASYCLQKQGVSEDDLLAELTRSFEEASLETGVEAVPQIGRAHV